MNNAITDKGNDINICESCVFDIAGCWPPLHCKVDVKKKYTFLVTQNMPSIVFQLGHILGKKMVGVKKVER